MSRLKRALMVGGAVAMVLSVVLACPLRSGGDSAGRMIGKDQTRYIIRLNILVPGACKAMTVTEYPVGALAIEVRDPDDELLERIAWQAKQGFRTYLIPVTQRGEYEIKVTHIGTDNGETVQAAESISVEVRARTPTVVNIVPGRIGVITVEAEG